MHSRKLNSAIWIGSIALLGCRANAAILNLSSFSSDLTPAADLDATLVFEVDLISIAGK